MSTSFLRAVRLDLVANRGDRRMQRLLVLLRVAQSVRAAPVPMRILGSPLIAIYRSVALNFYGVDIPSSARIGAGLRICHGFGLVIHDRAIIDEHVTVRQAVTVGTRGPGGAPRVGARCDLGAGALVLGPVVLGEGTVVGAGSVVLESTPPGSVVVGNPARVIRSATPTSET